MYDLPPVHCAKHDITIDAYADAWDGCPLCVRESRVAAGCRCNGTGVCPECLIARIDGRDKCHAECSSLCRVCNPDD